MQSKSAPWRHKQETSATGEGELRAIVALSGSASDRSKQIVTTDEVCKVGLCCYDNKRYLLGDGITSFSYGHFRIANPDILDEPEPEV